MAALLTGGVLAGSFSSAAENAYVKILLATGAFFTFFAEIWWTALFAKLNYELKNKSVIIQSGILFRRLTAIPQSAILAQTTFYIRLTKKYRAPLFTILHTAGSRFVIFAEFSTNC